MPPVLRGLAASLSIAAGYLPIAFSFGLAAMQGGISPLITALTSILIYAGASQFVLIALLAPGASLLGAIPTVLLMNARHLFYGPALLDRFTQRSAQLPAPLLAFGLTDEVFATAMSKIDAVAPQDRERWHVGLQLGAYLSWVLGTLLGIALSDSFQNPPVFVREGLSFILPGLFFALLLELDLRRWHRIVLATALACILLMAWLPVHHALALAMVAGASLNLLKRTP